MRGRTIIKINKKAVAAHVFKSRPYQATARARTRTCRPNVRRLGDAKRAGRSGTAGLTKGQALRQAAG
jgi:hypothetical protein